MCADLDGSVGQVDDDLAVDLRKVVVERNRDALIDQGLFGPGYGLAFM